MQEMIRNTELEEATESGIEKGSKEKALEIAKNLIAMKLSDEKIATSTGLSIEEIEALK